MHTHPSQPSCPSGAASQSLAGRCLSHHLRSLIHCICRRRRCPSPSRMARVCQYRVRRAAFVLMPPPPPLPIHVLSDTFNTASGPSGQPIVVGHLRTRTCLCMWRSTRLSDQTPTKPSFAGAPRSQDWGGGRGGHRHTVRRWSGFRVPGPLLQRVSAHALRASLSSTLVCTRQARSCTRGCLHVRTPGSGCCDGRA